MIALELLNVYISTEDRRLVRNIKRFRNLIKKFVRDVRSGTVKSDNDSDLLSILIKSDLYKDDEELLVDEVITFFGAGMKTIQTSTTNMLYFLMQNDDYLKQVCSETFPVIDKVKDNILEKLDYDAVMEFQDTAKIYSEVLRIQPPVSISSF